MNKKGFATSTIVFALLALFIMALSILLMTMMNITSTKKTLNQNTVNNIEYGNSSLNKLEQRVSELENRANKIVDEIYPIGSIYMSESFTTEKEVNDKLGGTWEKYAVGKTIIGAGTGTDASGNTRIFSVANNSKNLGNYTHSHNTPLFKASSTSSSVDGNAVFTNWNGSNWGYGSLTEIKSSAYANFTISGVAGAKKAYPLKTSTADTLQPYIVTYIYKRVK